MMNKNTTFVTSVFCNNMKYNDAESHQESGGVVNFCSNLLHVVNEMD